jgi:hypothetical protein
MHTHPQLAAAYRRATQLVKTAHRAIAGPKNHPSITKQSQFPASKTKIFVTKPKESPHPSS